LVLTLAARVDALPLVRFAGVDVQSQYTGFTPVVGASGIFTFNDTLNGTNPSPEPGVVTTEEAGGLGLLNGRISLEMDLDTSSYNPATGTVPNARFIGTGPMPEVLIWNAAQTTVLLAFDIVFVDANTVSSFAIAMGDSEDLGASVNSRLKLVGGSLYGAALAATGGHRLSTLQIIVNRPVPAPTMVASGSPGYLNNSFAAGIGAPSSPPPGVNWAISIIPEPATGLLVTLSLVGLSAYSRGRRAARR
jgi:hypothetical protein